MEIRDIDLLKNLDILLQNKVVVWGAGNDGKTVLRALINADIPVDCVCDRDKAKHGQQCLGITILSPQEIQKKASHDALIIIIASNLYSEEILHSLEDEGICPSGGVYSHFGVLYALDLNLFHPHFNPVYRMYQQQHLELLEYHLGAELNRIEDDALTMLSYSNDTPPVWVYTAGKVGTTTVSTSINSAGIPAIQIHHFHSKRTKAAIASSNKKIKIITLAREPISKIISNYMEHFFNSGSHGLNPEVSFDICKNIQDVLMFPVRSNGETDWLKWFDTELCAITGIDIFKYPFDREKGYGIIQTEKYEILVLTLEHINDNIQRIADFIGVSNFKLIAQNESSKLGRRHLYKNVKTELEVPKQSIDYYYNGNRYVDYFYTEKDKERFLTQYRITE